MFNLSGQVYLALPLAVRFVAFQLAVVSQHAAVFRRVVEAAAVVVALVLDPAVAHAEPEAVFEAALAAAIEAVALPVAEFGQGPAPDVLAVGWGLGPAAHTLTAAYCGDLHLRRPTPLRDFVEPEVAHLHRRYRLRWVYRPGCRRVAAARRWVVPMCWLKASLGHHQRGVLHAKEWLQAQAAAS